MKQFRDKIDSVVQEMKIEMKFKTKPEGNRKSAGAGGEAAKCKVKDGNLLMTLPTSKADLDLWKGSRLNGGVISSISPRTKMPDVKIINRSNLTAAISKRFRSREVSAERAGSIEMQTNSK